MRFPESFAAASATIVLAGLTALSVSAIAANQDMGQPEMMATEISVTGTEFSFTPNRITIQAGQPVVLQLATGGELSHNFTIDAPSGEMRSPTFRPGEPVSFDLTIDEPGTYAFFCSFTSAGGHRANGMEGTIEVLPGGAFTMSAPTQ